MTYPHSSVPRSGAVPGIIMLFVILFVLNLIFKVVPIPWPDWSPRSSTTASGDEGELRAALVDRYNEELDRRNEYDETSHNRSKAIDDLTDGRYLGDAWCATFVTSITGQVYKDLGYDPPMYGGEDYGNLADYILPRVHDTNSNDGITSLTEWAKAEDRFYTRDDVRNGRNDIQLGDFVIFDQSNGRSSNHTGAVIDIDGNTIITAEGNTSTGLDTRDYNALDTSDIYGFVDVGFQ